MAKETFFEVFDTENDDSLNIVDDLIRLSKKGSRPVYCRADNPYLFLSNVPITRKRITLWYHGDIARIQKELKGFQCPTTTKQSKS